LKKLLLQQHALADLSQRLSLHAGVVAVDDLEGHLGLHRGAICRGRLASRRRCCDALAGSAKVVQKLVKRELAAVSQRAHRRRIRRETRLIAGITARLNGRRQLGQPGRPRRANAGLRRDFPFHRHPHLRTRRDRQINRFGQREDRQRRAPSPRGLSVRIRWGPYEAAQETAHTSDRSQDCSHRAAA
jgi:hypothetical protein